MNRFFDDACIEGWEGLTEGITLPDPNDVHVVAAALRGRADVIVTSNLKDFPLQTLDGLGLDVQSPDEFLINQLDLDPEEVMGCLECQRLALKNPQVTMNELLSRLERCGAVDFVGAARKQVWRIR